MTEEEDDGAESVLRTVTAPYRSRADYEMSTFGILVGLGMVILFIPLLPIIVVLWVLGKVMGGRRRGVMDSG